MGKEKKEGKKERELSWFLSMSMWDERESVCVCVQNVSHIN